eukprot:356524-Chlamydomonas_euryale.AAC.7
MHALACGHCIYVAGRRDAYAWARLRGARVTEQMQRSRGALCHAWQGMAVHMHGLASVLHVHGGARRCTEGLPGTAKGQALHAQQPLPHVCLLAGGSPSRAMGRRRAMGTQLLRTCLLAGGWPSRAICRRRAAVNTAAAHLLGLMCRQQGRGVGSRAEAWAAGLSHQQQH